MSREQTLMKAALDVTGDTAIREVAEFMPEEIAEDAILNVRDDLRPRHVSAPGSDDAQALAADIASGRTTLPPHVCLAVTPSVVHVLGIPHGFWAAHPERAYLMGTLDRDALDVTVTGRLTDRLVTLDDRASGAHLSLVADRLSTYHPKALIELLRMGPAHQTDDG